MPHESSEVEPWISEIVAAHMLKDLNPAIKKMVAVKALQSFGIDIPDPEITIIAMMEALERVGCQSDHCPGPDEPHQDMATCYVCDVLARVKLGYSARKNLLRERSRAEAAERICVCLDACAGIYDPVHVFSETKKTLQETRDAVLALSKKAKPSVAAELAEIRKRLDDVLTLVEKGH